MKSVQPPRAIEETLDSADVRLNGTRPWDVQVHDDRLWNRIARSGTLGLGDAYCEGWWDCDALDELFYRILSAEKALHLRPSVHTMQGMLGHLVKGVSKRASRKVGLQHYDLGNDFFEAMLDPYMQYSCGYFEQGATDIADAQMQKLDRICRKLQLQPSDHVLDIGCGWGGLAQYISQHYGCRVTGVTISKEQATYATERCRGLPVDIRLCDYRDMKGEYDKVVSVGMFEHVGWHNYPLYMRSAKRCMKKDGLFLLHTIGCRRTGYGFDPWIVRHIFPHSALPSAAQISKAADGVWTMEDWHNFGVSYDKTLMQWHTRSKAYMNAHENEYDSGFRRLWRYYLLSCAGAFRARSIHLWQVVLSPAGHKGGYHSIR